VKQPAVAKLEKRADMYVSNLRPSIEAMGGALEITAKFPGATVTITGFSGIGDGGQPPEPRPPRYRGSGALLPGLSWLQVPVLTCIDRNNHHLEKRTKAEVLNRLEKLMEPGTVLCSDDFQGYAALAGKVGAEHRIIERRQDTWLKKATGHAPRQKGALGLGRVNSHHQAMETLVNRILRGVSTKYLPAYLTMLRVQRHPPAKLTLGIGPAMASPWLKSHGAIHIQVELRLA
jgi:hypothetical protein